MKIPILPCFVLVVVELCVLNVTGRTAVWRIPHGYGYEKLSNDGNSYASGFSQSEAHASLNGKPVPAPEMSEFFPSSLNFGSLFNHELSSPFYSDPELFSNSAPIFDGFESDHSHFMNPFELLDDSPLMADKPSSEALSQYAQKGERPEFVSNWPAKGEQKKMGEISGIAICPVDRTKMVLHRGDRIWDINTFDLANRFVNASKLGPIKEATIAVFKDGKIIEEFGKDMFYMPHGITIDSKRNIWVTDLGLHQVLKFSPEDRSKPSLVLGERLVPGSDEKHFCKPTHVAVASNGDFFVADGYCNSRIMKFSPTGKLIKQWGHKSESFFFPKPDALEIPHQLALVEEEDLICVADREHNRVVCYSAGLTSRVKKATTPNKKLSGDKTSVSSQEDDEFEEDQYSPSMPVEKRSTHKHVFMSMKESTTKGTVGKPSVVIHSSEFGPVFGVAYAPKQKSLMILGGVSPSIDRSKIYMFDLKSLTKTGEIDYPAPQGFGYAHALASCPLDKKDETKGDCVAVAALASTCSSTGICAPTSLEEVKQNRRLWLYNFV